MACAWHLASAGARVVVVETRKKLGGRATSFTDARSGRILDNCQHVVLGCCTNYMDFLARMGVDHHIKWHREQYWFETGGRRSVIKATGLLGQLPAPGHYSASVLACSFLSVAEKIELARGMLDVMAADRAAHGSMTFGTFLQGAGQSERLIRRFWEPVVVSACNLPCDRVAASSALHVFQEGFLAHRNSADIGISDVPLTDLYENLTPAVERAGGQVELGMPAGTIWPDRVTLARGGELRAGRVICAADFTLARRLVAPEVQAADHRFAAMATFTTSPILGVTLAFDRPVMDTPHAVLVERPTQWLFAKNEARTIIHAVISASDQWQPLDEQAIGNLIASDIRACLPMAQGASLLWCRAVREKLATIAPTPSMESCRPGALPSGVAGEPGRAGYTSGPDRALVLAGDYTNTGWPSTMEGAVRSGAIAAACVLGKPPESFLRPSLPIAPLGRWLGLRPGQLPGVPNRLA